jgi:hypothetical protein
MYIPFNQLPPNSRVWIYQASRSLTDEEVTSLNPLLSRFSAEWTSHGETLQASAQIFHNRFLVLANNEDVNSPSGCSIDASVRFVKELEQKLNVSFFDRTQLAFLKNNGVEVVPLKAVKEKISAGELEANSLYFDNTVPTAGHILNNWPKPAKETWLARYF